MKLIQDITYVSREEEDIHLDLYLPDSEKFDIFVFFHGGGLERGNKANTSARLIGPWLSERGVAVASCDYRKYPNAKYPDFVRDAAAAVHWVSNNISKYGKCKRIFVGGNSAGAYLSMMLCFDARWYAECGELPIAVAGYFHDSGQPTCHFNVLRERGIDTRRIIIDDSAPLYHMGVCVDVPPMMFVNSDDDIQNRHEQIGLVLSTLKHFEYDESKIYHKLMHGRHCEHCKAVDENGDSVFGRMILDFIEKI